jgi:flagellar hook assembly protein FlgD
MMRKVFVLVALLTLATSISFGAEFVPTPLKIAAPEIINWDFEGNLAINVNITGTPSKTIFCVFTKDKADNIVNIQNGFLGWHYVNKIDTCIFYDQGTNMQIGSNTIIWDGSDMDGNRVPPGEYYYYLKGYDYQNFKQNASNVISIGMGRYDTIITHDRPTGTPYAQPILYTDPFGGSATYRFGRQSGSRMGYNNSTDPTNRMKFIIGSDPDDPNGIERTWYEIWFEHAAYEPSPYDSDMFYTVSNDMGQYYGHMRRYTWVPNGESIWDTSWGEDGEVVWSILTNGSWWVRLAAAFSYIEGDMFIGANTDHSGISTQSQLPVVDAIDGFILDTIDLKDWWIRPDDAVPRGAYQAQQSSGPNHAIYRNVNGMPSLVLTAHSTCLQNVINPRDPDRDWQRWINGNGDYIADHNWEPDSPAPWVCHDYGPPARTYTANICDQGFVMSSAYEEGAVSFHLFAPDGTGIGMFPFAGETPGLKYIQIVVQYGSAYDGLYTDNESSDPESREWNERVGGVWYVAHDSMRGVITNQEVSVKEAAPVAFSVDQNVPNPFNPTTTINFSLADARNVTMDVFNLAGQKVDTLVNSHLQAGNHSVVWDASNFAAGVYFCSVKAGDYSKVVKMTLLK